MSSTKEAIFAIDAEIEALDGLMKLETKKLELLRAARHALLSPNTTPKPEAPSAPTPPKSAITSPTNTISRATSQSKVEILPATNTFTQQDILSKTMELKVPN